MNDPVQAAVDEAIEAEEILIDDKLDELEDAVVEDTSPQISDMTPEQKLSVLLADSVAEEADKPDLSIFAQFETDQSAEEEGRWMPITYNVDFKLRRFGSMKSAEARDLAEKIVRQQTGKKGVELSPMENLEVSTVQLAKGILVDWRGTGLRDNDGKPIGFSAEAAYLMLKRLPNVTITAIAMSLDIDNYRFEDTQDAVKN